jgi:hypothetical protein
LENQRENHSADDFEPANSASDLGPRYLTTRGAAVYLGLGEEAKDGVPTIGSRYQSGCGIVTLTMRVDRSGALVGDDGHAVGWIDLARLNTVEFPLVERADPLAPALQRLEKWRAQGKGPPSFKLGPARGDEVLYAIDELDEWMDRHRREQRRAG